MLSFSARAFPITRPPLPNCRPMLITKCSISCYFEGSSGRLNGLSSSLLNFFISRLSKTNDNESQRILKAQASRGVDFKEGKLKDKINQIISLLVPMFVISYKKAEDLAFAMEARGYIPGKERTKLEVLKYKASDYITYAFLILFIAFIISGKILQVI